MKLSCDVIHLAFMTLMTEGQTVIKYTEFSPNIVGDEEGMTCLFAVVTLDKDNEIHLWNFEYYPGSCRLRESNNGKRWFVKEHSHDKSKKT